jgi:hypothetical protein
MIKGAPSQNIKIGAAMNNFTGNRSTMYTRAITARRGSINHNGIATY